jgi:hypothetical protein
MKISLNPLDLLTLEVSFKGLVEGVRSVASLTSTHYPTPTSNRKP